MRAAVVFNKGALPRFTCDFPAPVVKNEGEILMTVKAVAVKHLDKMRASGKHYSARSDSWEPKVVGSDGAGILEDGTRVYALGLTGTIAEKAIIESSRMVAIPDALDFDTAAALPNGIMGSALALLFRAKLKKGETVLINGATGFTGKIAVQLARHYGANTIIATGRNERALSSLQALGADQIIPLRQSDESLIEEIKHAHKDTPIDIVIDYTWGHPARMILQALQDDGGFTHATRYVTVGAMAGDTIELSSSILRSTNIQISGSGLGSWTKAEVQSLIKSILPEVFQLAAEKKLVIETIKTNLEDIEKVWSLDVTDGKRLVIQI